MKKLVLAVFLMLLALAGAAYCQDSALKNTTIKITYPEKNAKVATNEVIEGISKNIPPGYELWIVVYPRSVGRYYFQDFKPQFMPNGDWSNSAIIGDAMSGGQKFDVYPTLADSKANEFIKNDLENCNKNQSWSGLKELPEGTTIMDKVTVIRG